MGRKRREDAPGMWHHVFNRGLAHRTVFESAQVVRFFQSRVARSVRRGEIEVHAYVMMTTHFHLLVRSSTGRLSTALKRIESEFVRWFNRKHGRDGSLFRGRFGSRPVKSLGYRQLLVRYIDQNPVVAQLVPTAEDYPHGSAARFVQETLPPWLSRDWIADDLRHWTDRGIDWKTAYRTAYSARHLSQDERFVLERRMASRPPARGFDDLIAAAPSTVRNRFLHDTHNADGTKPGWPTVGPDAITNALEDARREAPIWTRPNSQASVWHIAEAALLRNLCAMRLAEIGQRLELTASSVKRRHVCHLDLLERDPAYASRFASLVERCVRSFQETSTRT